MFGIRLALSLLIVLVLDFAARRATRVWHRRALDRRPTRSAVARRLTEANLRAARYAAYMLEHDGPLLAAYRFLTDRDYATGAMGAWFDVMSDAHCDVMEGVAEGRDRWSYYDWHHTPAAHWRAFRFRTQARLTRIHSWVFWQVDRVVMRLCLTVR